MRCFYFCVGGMVHGFYFFCSNSMCTLQSADHNAELPGGSDVSMQSDDHNTALSDNGTADGKPTDSRCPLAPISQVSCNCKNGMHVVRNAFLMIDTLIPCRMLHHCRGAANDKPRGSLILWQNLLLLENPHPDRCHFVWIVRVWMVPAPRPLVN